MDQVLPLFNISVDYDLNIMTDDQPLPELTANLITKLSPILEKENVSMVIVQGDTTTTFAAALTAFYHRIPVAHVEAGLRTNNRYYPFPEEMNRRLTSALTTIHFAPTRLAKENLLKEGIPETDIVVTGNTVIDALLTVIETRHIPTKTTANHFREILVTAHRRESWGKPLEEICQALLDIVKEFQDVKIVFPVHLNPNVRKTVYPMLSDHPRIILTEPMDYLQFVTQMASSYLILTDSGGIQEEAPSLGKPVLVMRNETERLEALEAGTCRLVGTQHQKIVEEVSGLLTNPDRYTRMAQAVNPYGDGKASQRIVQYLIKYFTT
ncbi:MAG: UDP-N-acetylglucosamine 2-epimerase (non-hydrolyzing) [Methanobacteriota archaeon]|nr:MAG: UDP-N-acetylglucosamine 2-epimerase (non-hydrolyzing) [Euryarchaeota archaeon]